MSDPSTSMFEEEFDQIQGVVDHLAQSTDAIVVLLVDRNAQLIATSAPPEGFDLLSLAAQIAREAVMTDAGVEMHETSEVVTRLRESASEIHVRLAGTRVFLAVIFDARSSRELVHARAEAADVELDEIIKAILEKFELSLQNGPTLLGIVEPDSTDDFFND